MVGERADYVGPDVESDPGQIVLQLDDTGSPTHRYLWGPAVDQILADEVVDDGSAEDVRWPLGDHQQTVHDMVAYDEVQQGWSVANHVTYDAFGKVTAETNAAVDHLFGYTGRPFDKTTGLQNNLNRWYDPAIGRWLSEDPIGFEGGDANLYRYVANSPLNGMDTSGLAGLSGGGYLVIENAFGFDGPNLEALAEAAGARLGIEGFENRWSEIHEIRKSFRTAQRNDIVIFYGHSGSEQGKVTALIDPCILKERFQSLSLQYAK